MKYLVTDIISELQQLVNDQITYLDAHVLGLSDDDLRWRPSQYKWNIYEVIEHLNRFGVFYLPKLRNVLDYPKSTKQSTHYKSSFIGEFAFKQIRPVNGIVNNKTKSLSKNNPFLRRLDRAVIEEHKEQQFKILEYSESSTQINLSKNKVPSMVGNWFKFNLGDSLRLLIYHQERHYVQIDELVQKKMDIDK